MKQEQKAVHYYGLSLLEGCYVGMTEESGYTLALSGAFGAYITPMFDTGEEACTYHRLTVDGDFDGAKLEVIVMATDLTNAELDGETRLLKHYLGNDNTPAPQKAEVLRHLPHVRAVNQRDILLYDLKGRYVWVYVALHHADQTECRLSGLRLTLPKISFTEYFPEIYWGNDFFDRYIAVFQSMFLDLERRVDEIPRLLDYRVTPDPNVEVLAGWLGIDNPRGLFTPDQLRHIIENIDVFQGAKGSKHAMESIIVLLTGIKPRIVEYFQWARPQFSAHHTAINKRLYGETANHFCVIMDLTRARLPVGEGDLEHVIENYSVMGSCFKVVYLRLCSHTDIHCYLGINSVLSTPEIAGLGMGTFGEHITVG